MTGNFEGLLGLCRRAGKLILGLDNIEKNTKKCVLIVAASDASDRTARSIKAFGKPVILTDMTKAQLGSLFGAGDVAACGITDPNFASALQDKSIGR